jgi:peptide deformylase
LNDPKATTTVILPIRTLGDPVLKTPSHPLTTFDPKLRKLFDDMVETMYAAPGVGLAAPQVGLSQRLFVYNDGITGPRFIANPELSEGEGEFETDEGCLSLPGPYAIVKRYATITCRGQDLDGTWYTTRAGDLLARIFQHETDHLDGRLFIDRLDDEARRAVLAELRRVELGLEEPRSKRRFLRRGAPAPSEPMEG